MRAEMREAIDIAEQFGARYVGLTKCGHLRFATPRGKIIIGPSRNTDWRGIRNFRSFVRRTIALEKAQA